MKLKITNTAKELTLLDLIHTEGYFSKDIKQKIIHNQFLINGIPMSNEDLRIKISAFDEAGEFAFNNAHLLYPLQIFHTFYEMFESDLPFFKRLFDEVKLIKLSKRKMIVIKSPKKN